MNELYIKKNKLNDATFPMDLITLEIEFGKDYKIIDLMKVNKNLKLIEYYKFIGSDEDLIDAAKKVNNINV